MRVLAGCVVALCLIASPAMAGANDGSNAAANSPAPAAANSANANPSPAAKPETVTTESDLQQLKDLIEAQSKQLDEQQQELKEQQQEMQALKQQLNSSNTASPAGVVAAAPVAAPTAAAIGPVVGATPTNAALAVGTPAEPAQTPDEPASIHYKGITLTPGGFFAAETAWRQRALSADVNSSFNAMPMPGASPYNISEFNASGRQSRIAMLVQGSLPSVKIGGYYEADFLSAGVTSNGNQSNSYTLRQRQFWGQAAFTNGFTITGGQMWSLVTQTAKGLDPRTEVLPETIDAQYSVGFSWARQYGVRFEKNFNNKAWVAMSVEAPQTKVAVAGTTLPYLYGESGAGGGLYNSTTSYSFNETPDFIFKAAIEPGFGHYEVFGLVSTFRDRIFPGGGAANYNSTTVGGGGGANAWFPFAHSHINLGLHVLAGNGVGRYGSAQSAPDVTVQPNGTFATVTSYQGLATLAFHYTKWDVYFHVGEEYGDRTEFAGDTVGYGATDATNGSGCWTEPNGSATTPGSLTNCSNNIKDVVEGTAGFWYSFYAGPKGTFKLGLQYSNFSVNTWPGFGASGVCASVAHPSCAPSPNENMFFTSMRYYIP